MSVLGTRERLLGPALRTQPDQRLATLARGGNEAALDEVVRRYRAALVRFAGRIVGAAAAEDVVQDSLAKALPALARTEDEVQLRPWLYAIVRNTALNHLRDAGPAAEQLDENYDGVEQPPQALERREGLRSLVGGLRGLPGQQREALVKRELEGRSHEEIGADLGVSKGAARQLVFRARESLRVGFGSLLPMPLLRRLAEGGGSGAGDSVGIAAGAGGSALATKAVIAVLATGAAVGGAVAVDHGVRGRDQGPPAAEAAARPGVDGATAAGSRAGTSGAPVPRVIGLGGAAGAGDGSGAGDDGEGPRGSGPGDGQSDPDRDLGHGDDRGHRGAKDGSGGDDGSGGHDGGGETNNGRGPSDNDSSSGSDSSGSGSRQTGSNSSGSRQSGAGDSGFRHSGSDSSGSSRSGSDDAQGTPAAGTEQAQPATVEDTSDDPGSSGGGPSSSPSPAPESSAGGSSSGSSSDFSENSRDLSGAVVSQGTEDHD